MKVQISVLVVMITMGTTAWGMGLVQPYDTLIRPVYDNKNIFQMYFLGQTGFHHQGYNSDGCRVNVLRIWNADQNALAMLDGFASDSVFGQRRTQLDADDDGVRGHFNVSGALSLDAGLAWAARYFFMRDWSIDMYLPFYVMRLRDVQWIDQTKDLTDADRRVKTFLTNDFFTNVQQLSCLDLREWRRIGVGDLTLMLQWFHDFPQAKQILKNVRINWRMGLSLPTGLRVDENKIAAFSFGNDGAVSLPFGVGLDLTFGTFVKAGFDVQLTHIFGNTRARRIKTNINQTELLLLQKTDVYKDFALRQQFNLYGEFYRIYKGLSCMLGYQFIKHGDDILSITSNAFSSEIANTAERIQEWTSHFVIAKISYDGGYHLEDEKVKPYVSLFVRVPFNGKRAALLSTIGAVFALNF